MTVTVHASEVIDRPVAVVFAFYALDHVRNHPRWDPDMQLEQITPGPIGVGTVIRRVNTHGGTPVVGVMKVVELEPNRSFAVEIQDGPVRTNGGVSFEPLDANRTRITIYAEFPGIDDPALEHRLTPLVRRSARNIKSLVEAEH
ncbi:MAG TPA: SRPBCC family protein [Anaerolineales bacterium]|nr:SRPBCC family protein [Anaerolineales bacterium]